jgi:hypothetical protein
MAGTANGRTYIQHIAEHDGIGDQLGKFAELYHFDRVTFLAHAQEGSGRELARVAFMLPMGRGDSFECQSRRGGLIADGQRHQQHPIAIRDVGPCGIDWDRQGIFPIISADAPFIDEQLLDFFQKGALVSVKHEATIAGDFDQNIAGFQSSHRRSDHDAIFCPIHFDRDMLLFGLFLHWLRLSWHLGGTCGWSSLISLAIAPSCVGYPRSLRVVFAPTTPACSPLAANAAEWERSGHRLAASTETTS